MVSSHIIISHVLSNAIWLVFIKHAVLGHCENFDPQRANPRCNITCLGNPSTRFPVPFIPASPDFNPNTMTMQKLCGKLNSQQFLHGFRITRFILGIMQGKFTRCISSWNER